MQSLKELVTDRPTESSTSRSWKWGTGSLALAPAPFQAPLIIVTLASSALRTELSKLQKTNAALKIWLASILDENLHDRSLLLITVAMPSTDNQNWIRYLESYVAIMVLFKAHKGAKKQWHRWYKVLMRPKSQDFLSIWKINSFLPNRQTKIKGTETSSIKELLQSFWKLMLSTRM